MEAKLFKNGVKKVEKRKNFQMFATYVGIRIVNVSEVSEQFLLTYGEIENDLSVTDEEKVAEKVNELILEKIKERKRIFLTWDFKEDMDFKKLQQILIQNNLLQHQFDSE